MKDRQYIQQLLDRFMEGMTSEQEEQLLADYFSSTADIPEEWRAYTVMFGGFRQKSVLKRQPAKILPLKRWVAVAACAAGFVAILLMPPREKNQPHPYTTSQAEGMQMWQYDNMQAPIDAQIANQQEIKEKGERLTAYIQEQTKPNYDY